MRHDRCKQKAKLFGTYNISRQRTFREHNYLKDKTTWVLSASVYTTIFFSQLRTETSSVVNTIGVVSTNFLPKRVYREPGRLHTTEVIVKS